MISPGCSIGQSSPKPAQRRVTRIMRGVSGRRATSVATPLRRGKSLLSIVLGYPNTDWQAARRLKPARPRPMAVA
jgi:hypothetical protein